MLASHSCRRRTTGSYAITSSIPSTALQGARQSQRSVCRSHTQALSSLPPSVVTVSMSRECEDQPCCDQHSLQSLSPPGVLGAPGRRHLPGESWSQRGRGGRGPGPDCPLCASCPSSGTPGRPCVSGSVTCWATCSGAASGTARSSTAPSTSTRSPCTAACPAGTPGVSARQRQASSACSASQQPPVAHLLSVAPARREGVWPHRYLCLPVSVSFFCASFYTKGSMCLFHL